METQCRRGRGKTRGDHDYLPSRGASISFFSPFRASFPWPLTPDALSPSPRSQSLRSSAPDYANPSPRGNPQNTTASSSPSNSSCAKRARGRCTAACRRTSSASCRTPSPCSSCTRRSCRGAAWPRRRSWRPFGGTEGAQVRWGEPRWTLCSTSVECVHVFLRTVSPPHHHYHYYYHHHHHLPLAMVTTARKPTGTGSDGIIMAAFPWGSSWGRDSTQESLTLDYPIRPKPEPTTVCGIYPQTKLRCCSTVDMGTATASRKKDRPFYGFERRLCLFKT